MASHPMTGTLYPVRNGHVKRIRNARMRLQWLEPEEQAAVLQWRTSSRLVASSGTPSYFIFLCPQFQYQTS
jgi:hypothetical protein